IGLDRVNTILVARKLIDNPKSAEDMFEIISLAPFEQLPDLATLLANEIYAFSVQFYRFIDLSEFKNRQWEARNSDQPSSGTFAYQHELTNKLSYYLIE